MAQYPAPATYTVYTAACGHRFVYEGGDRSIEECQASPCWTCSHSAGQRTGTEDIRPLTHTPEGMVIDALERGVDVEARFARWNEDELSEEDDW